MKKKILMVSGTRPEIIKLALLYHALKEVSWADVYWVHTGQHDTMAADLFACFNVAPDYSFSRQGNGLAEFSQGCRAQLEQIMLEQKWSLVMIQGDTESAFLGALAGFYHQIPVAHVEAGLRTYCLSRPFPEEGLRQMIARVTRLHFAPTIRSEQNLLNEHIPASQIFMTGNTGVDAQHWATRHHGIVSHLKERHLLVTVHRRENWGKNLEDVCAAIVILAKRYPEMRVLFPVHPNPVVHNTVYAMLAGLPNVRLTTPLDYLAIQQALIDAWLVMTDSGGLQEEAPTYGVPILVLREETERLEAVESGYAQLVGTEVARIVKDVSDRWEHFDGSRMSQQNPFGDGLACSRIVHIIHQALLGS